MWWILVATLSLSVQAPDTTEPAERPAELTRARDIRLLPPDRAALGLPVRLEAVITYIDSGYTTFVQDDTAGTFFQGPPRDPNWKIGLRVRIEGNTFSGLYVPGIKATRVRAIGPGEVPPPIRITTDDLAAGTYHYQWVEVEGIGRSVTVTGENTSVLRLALGSRPMEVRVDEVPPDHLELVDARLRVRGLASGFINDRRQLVQPYLKAMTYREIAVIEPAPDPSSLPVVSIDDQLRFTPHGISERRVKVQGVVLSDRPGEPIFLREGDRGLSIQAEHDEPLRPGDRVEVLGFPVMGSFRAFLADATIRRIGGGAQPVPRRVDAGELLAGIRDADLVEMDGRLVATSIGPEGIMLTLEDEDTVFRVRCPSGPLPEWTAGSRLSVSGICRIAGTTDRGYRLEPRSFELWARSPDDIRVLGSPAWWTARRLTRAIAALGLATVAALVWVFLLRQRVREQTAVIRSQFAREIVLGERQRIAREFHDTLEQELVGLSLRLDAAAAIADARLLPMLVDTRRLVSRIHVEVRDLVWDLREEADSPRDLGQSLEGLTRELRQAAPIRFDVVVTGTPWPLPGYVEHNLLRIAQEAITNAMKHADARSLEIGLCYESDRITLRIRDDGRGFEAHARADSNRGRFGLVGMQERARKVGARFSLTGGPGRGTTIEVILPRSPATLEGARHERGSVALDHHHGPRGG